MESKRALHLAAFLILVSLLNPAAADSHHRKSTKHIVLIHGAAHGAWSWYKLAPLLRSSGHNVSTFDLAASGIDPKQPLEVPLLSQFFKPISDFMGSLPENEKVVLVAHSFSGLGLSLALEKYPQKISAAVFVASLMPGPRTNFTEFWQETVKTQGDIMDTYVTYDNGPDKPPTTNVLGFKYLGAKVYHRCPVQDLTLARSLVRPFFHYSIDDIANTVKLSDKNYGKVKRVFIIAGDDHVLQKDYQEWMIRQNPPAEAILIKDSDHMTMLSQPKKLCRHILKVAEKY